MNPQIDPNLVGQLVRIKGYGNDAKRVGRALFSAIGTLEKVNDQLVIVRTPDEPALPERKGKRWVFQRSVVESCLPLAELSQVREEALKGALQLYLTHQSGQGTAHFCRLFDGRFKAVLFEAPRVTSLYDKNGETLLSSLEKSGYQITSWGA